ncbi:MAG: rRNA pseudouridine synthase [Halobacteriovoraceae bacterium]|jgi:23S rRNA pseudouridine2605 synthase|nr:rRNA pseudouridine synthase [Halobacteriovoraceae bacterium]MBT5096105.1 rRNA pseudouridine synthase [Halobacteriovoraceae bacterium]
MLRLQKYIADCGVTSRRKAEDLILQGRVEVNGEIVTLLGTKVDPEEDAVSVDGSMLDHRQIQKVYVVMNKPRGYVSTMSDPEGRKTVMDLCVDVSERVYPVGRLDYLSEGLLIMTNDGDLANKVMHPSHSIAKIYEVKVFGVVNQNHIRKLREGTQLEEGFVKPLSVRIVKQLPTKTWLEFRLGEGKNREIRRLCEACDLSVDKLKRVAIGGLTLEGLPPGSYKMSNRKQLSRLLDLDRAGNAVAKVMNYKSKKKSVSLKLKGVPSGTPADHENFKKFRKDTYFEHLKAIKETKGIVASKVLEEEKKVEREKEVRKFMRDKHRTAKKEAKQGARQAVHAIMLKD